MSAEDSETRESRHPQRLDRRICVDGNAPEKATFNRVRSFSKAAVEVTIEPTAELQKTLIHWVRTEIGPIATPHHIQFAPGLPKTRSGKIMRRILRKIAEGSVSADALGDMSTLADPNVVNHLVEGAQVPL